MQEGVNFQPKPSLRHGGGRRGGELAAKIRPETRRWHGMGCRSWAGEWWQRRIGSERQQQSQGHQIKLEELFGCSWGCEGWVRVVCQCCSFSALLPKTCVQVGALGKGRSKNKKRPFCAGHPYQTKLDSPSAPTSSFYCPICVR